jgi:hypothetical protein
MQSFQNMKLIVDKFKELLISDRKSFLESNSSYPALRTAHGFTSFYSFSLSLQADLTSIA